MFCTLAPLIAPFSAGSRPLFLTRFQLISRCSIDLSNKNESCVLSRKCHLIGVAGFPENGPKSCTFQLKHPKKPTSRYWEKIKLFSRDSQCLKVPDRKEIRPPASKPAPRSGGKEKNLGSFSCVPFAYRKFFQNLSSNKLAFILIQIVSKISLTSGAAASGIIFEKFFSHSDIRVIVLLANV